MLLYLLLWYPILVADFSRGETYPFGSTTEDHASLTLAEKGEDLPNEVVDYHAEKDEISDDDHQTESTVTIYYETEESTDTQPTSTTYTTLDFSSTSDGEEIPCVVPGPVSNLTTENISSDHLNISWLEPSYGSNCVSRYIISWSDSSTTMWSNETTTELNYTIEDLKPCTEYVISVFAEGKNGETSEPNNSTETTASAVPGPVSHLTIEDILSDSLNISWLAPSYGSNCVYWYIISWSDSSTTIWTTEKTDELHYRVESLDPCTQYYVSIVAEGINGEKSQPSISMETTSSVVPGPVSKLTIEAISPYSLNTSWLAPSYGSNCVKWYVISWNNSVTAIWSTERTSDLYYTIEDLDPCTKYMISVVAEGSNSEISEVCNSTATTASVVPGSILNLTIQDVLSDALSISWLEPSNGSNCVNGYIISWSDSSTTIWSNETTSELYYTIEDLNPCTEYLISVFAEGNNGETSPSSKTTETTASVVPGPVSILSAENVTSPDFLNISWMAPSFGGNCVKSYIVSWSDASNATWSNGTTAKLYYIIEDLIACTEYFVSVVAEGHSDETSEPSNAKESTASVVPGPVTILSAENVTSPDFLNISWMAPSFGGNCVKSYTVSWSDASNATWSNGTTAKLYYIIEDLIACTEYFVSVVAEGHNDETSEPSNAKESTASVVPGSISNLTIKDVLSDSLYISWLEPSYGSNCVNGYIISWSDSSTTAWSNETTSELYYTIEDLNPCTEYLISVFAEGNNGETSPSSKTTETTASAVPGPVTILSAENVTSPDFLNISWMAPSFGGNCVKSYTVSWSDASNATWSNGTTAKLYYIIEDLIACTEYFVSVVAEGHNDETSEPSNAKESTAPVVPDPVSGLTSGFLYPDERNVSVILNWRLPHNLKEILVGFLIAYKGYDSEVSNSEADQKLISWNDGPWDIDSCCSYTLYNLFPDYDYNVSVSTVIKCDGNGSESRYTSFRYPAGVPKTNDQSLKNLKPDPFATADPTKQAKLTLYSDFFGEENGRIISYAVIVAQERYQENPQAQRINGSKPIMNNWYNATAGEIIWPYQATQENWNPFTGSSDRNTLHFDVKETSFTLGTDECTNPGTYCNGELRPDTNYSVKIRAFTNGGYQDSQLFYFVTDSEVPIGMILGILFSIISLGAAGITFFMYRNGILNWPPPILKKHSAVSVPPPSIPIKKFPAHCTQMLQIPNKLSNEYQLLATLSADVYSNNTFLAAQSPENKKKNRYINILPYDSTRVTLEAIDDDPFSDYINASFIKGYSDDIEYIACQGPKEETHADFWRMIFQHDVHLVVMVTNLVENEKVKCYKYYPNLRETFEVGDMIIGCTSEINFPVYTARTFLLNKGERRRLVTQLHFREWPDFGTPDSSHNMIQFVHTVRDHAARGVGLTVVHCSAGVGRTGTLIALDILLQHICEHKSLDIFGTVFRLRKQRINMVQTEGQYAYIYKCIKEALEDPTIMNKSNSTTNSLEPIYENVGTSLKNLQYERLSQIGMRGEQKHI